MWMLLKYIRKVTEFIRVMCLNPHFVISLLRDIILKHLIFVRSKNHKEKNSKT